MALEEKDKTEVDGMIKTAIETALNPFKKILEEKEKTPPVETQKIPVPNPPKDNEQLEKEKKKEEETPPQKSFLQKLGEAIW